MRSAPTEPSVAEPRTRKSYRRWFKTLAQMKSLQILDLGFTPIADAGLPELAKLENLQTLRINGDKVTALGLRTSRN